jgi:hypothetical protein
MIEYGNKGRPQGAPLQIKNHLQKESLYEIEVLEVSGGSGGRFGGRVRRRE